MNGLHDLARNLNLASHETCTLMQAVLDAVADPILVISKDYQVWSINQAAKDSCLSSDDEIPRYCYELSHCLGQPCADDVRLCPLNDVLRTLKPVTVVHEHHTTQDLRFVEIAAAPLRDAKGELIGIVEAIHDITECRQAEYDLREALRKLKSLYAQNMELVNQLQRVSDRRGELLQAQIRAQEEERQRIARELHDELGQSLSGLALQIGALETLIQHDPQRAIDRLKDIHDVVSAATAQMYEIILVLRPAALDDLGLRIALRTFVERFLDDSGISFEINAEGFEQRLSPEVETVLYRVSQEALNNILKHAQADHVTITLRQWHGMVELEIADNGVGFDPDTLTWGDHSLRGLGFLGMQERVNLCAGTLDILANPGVGTLIRVRIPLRLDASDA